MWRLALSHGISMGRKAPVGRDKSRHVKVKEKTMKERWTEFKASLPSMEEKKRSGAEITASILSGGLIREKDVG